MAKELRELLYRFKNRKQFFNENNDSNKKIVFHGGKLNNGLVDNLFYVSYNKEQAKAYASRNSGVVHKFEIDMKNIITEDDARDILVKNNFQSKENGWDLETELNLYEILDPNFTTSLSDEDLDKYFDILKSRGVTGIEFTDMDIISLRNGIQNILVIDLSILKKVS
jgi:hypothetical protein